MNRIFTLIFIFLVLLCYLLGIWGYYHLKLKQPLWFFALLTIPLLCVGFLTAKEIHLTRPLTDPAKKDHLRVKVWIFTLVFGLLGICSLMLDVNINSPRMRLFNKNVKAAEELGIYLENYWKQDAGYSELDACITTTGDGGLAIVRGLRSKDDIPAIKDLLEKLRPEFEVTLNFTIQGVNHKEIITVPD